MKKIFVKISVAAIFVAVLLMNISVNANKNVTDVNLSVLETVAKASCEGSDSRPHMNWGICSAGNTICLYDASGGECMP